MTSNIGFVYTGRFDILTILLTTRGFQNLFHPPNYSTRQNENFRRRSILFHTPQRPLPKPLKTQKTLKVRLGGVQPKGRQSLHEGLCAALQRVPARGVSFGIHTVDRSGLTWRVGVSSHSGNNAPRAGGRAACPRSRRCWSGSPSRPPLDPF